jgi:ATP-dependent helicase/nuclease subunit B
MLPDTLSAPQLIAGPYRSGKTRAGLKAIFEHCLANPLSNNLVIVPSARYRDFVEKNLLDLLKDKLGDNPKASLGLIKPRVLPFYRACELVLASSGITYSAIPAKCRPPVIAAVLDELKAKNELVSLLPIAHFAGTYASVLDLIDAIERLALPPKALMQLLNKSAGKDARLIELARIYQAYWDKLDSLGCVDERRLAYLARELLFSRQAKLNLSFVFIDGFDRISPLQADVFAGLSQYAESMQVAFDHQPRTNTPAQAAPVLTDQTGQLTLAIPSATSHVVQGSAGNKQADLFDQYHWKEPSYNLLVSTLKPEIIHAGKNPDTHKATINKFSCADRFAEMQEIARRVKHAIVFAGRKPEDVLVVARSLASYRTAIEAAFQDAQLPYFIDEALQLVELPLVKFLLKLLSLSITDFKRNDVISCLRSSYLNRTQLSLSDADIDEIDNKSLQLAVVAGKQQWQNFAAKYLSQTQRQALAALFAAVDNNGSKQSLTQFCLWAEDLIDKLVVVDKDGPNDLAAYKDHQALIGIRGIISNLLAEEKLLGEKHSTFAELLAHFQSLVEESNFRVPPDNTNAVTICGAELAPNHCYKEVCIAGLVEGEFPSGYSRSGLLSQAEISNWATFGVQIDDARSQPGFEWSLYQSLIERAEVACHLSYPRADFGGEELFPSFFLTLGKSEKELNIEAIAAFRQSSKMPVSDSDALAGWLWFIDENKTSAPKELQDHPLTESAFAQVDSKIAGARSRIHAGNTSLYNGYLVDQVSVGALTVKLPKLWSATRLNNYGKCPFRYLVTHGYNFVRREEPTGKLDYRLLGEAYHHALQEFFQGLKDAGHSLKDIDEAEFADRYEQARKNVISWLERHPRFQAGPFWNYDKMDIAFRLKRFLEAERNRLKTDQDGFEPQLFEIPFGEDNEKSYPPLVIAGNEPITIRGRVDRIDVSRLDSKSLRVVDYKSSSATISAEDARSGRNIQMALYALAASATILPGQPVTRGSYLSISSGEQSGQLKFNEEKHATILADTQEHIRRFVSAIAQGDFRVEPNGHQVCKSCEHATICRIKELSRGDEEADD